ncbi:MAG: thioredoxin family protein, partial [Planctomycetaceae bacterium]|nr:thioredoxin family protein [Planctomycetaceae bacterium]
FAGGLLVMASKGEFFWPIVGMLAFSGAFASPFFFLALFPKMLTKMPKSGGWMNIMKVTMGFVEVGAALKFLSVADTAFFGQPTVLTHNIVMGLWFLLAVLAGLYPLGLYRMPHDMPGKFTAGRLAFAVPFLALAGLLGTGLFTSIQPSGWIWDNVVAFAPPKFESPDQTDAKEAEAVTADIGPYVENDELPYALDFFEALDYARETKQPIFLDITGQNCQNCRLMEYRVFPRPENRELLKRFVRVKLFTDQIPIIEEESERKDLININKKIQIATNKSVALPGYVVSNPYNVGEDGKLIMLSWYEGMEKNEGEFTKFLNDGLEVWQKQSGEDAVQAAATTDRSQSITQK